MSLSHSASTISQANDETLLFETWLKEMPVLGIHQISSCRVHVKSIFDTVPLADIGSICLPSTSLKTEPAIALHWPLFDWAKNDTLLSTVYELSLTGLVTDSPLLCLIYITWSQTGYPSWDRVLWVPWLGWGEKMRVGLNKLPENVFLDAMYLWIRVLYLDKEL